MIPNLITEGLGWSLALGLFLFSPSLPASPVSNPSVVALPSPTISPEPASAPALVTKTEAKTLLREFNRALHAESRALDHRQKFELKDLRASQAARKKEWEARERETRRDFFAKNAKGPERRAYIQDFLERRKTLHKMMAEEKRERVRIHDVRRKALREDQTTRSKEFNAYLNRGERPPERLWPQPGT